MSLMRAAVGRDRMVHIVDKAVPHVRAREVRIKVSAAGVNRADLLQKMGLYSPPEGVTDVLGLECSGTVDAVGDKVRSVAVGDRVLALLKGGGYGEYVSVDERCVGSIPNDMSFVEAAAIPEVWSTAYQLTKWIGQVKKGEKVLVHAAGSGVGLAAIQLAAGMGAKVAATAGSDTKLKKAAELGAESCINYKTNPAFSEVLGDNSMDVILDCVGASYWRENLRCIAPDGRWVLYGTLGGPKVPEANLGVLLRKRVRIQATTLRSRPIEYQGELFSEMRSHVLPRIVSGEFANVIHGRIAFEDVNKAHEILESSSNTGKVIVQVSPTGEGGK